MNGIFIFILWAAVTGAATAALLAALRDYGTARLWNLLTVIAVFLHAGWLLRWRGAVFIIAGMLFGGVYGLSSMYGYNPFATGFIYLVKSKEGWEAYRLFGLLPAQIPVFWAAYAYISFLVSEFISWRWLRARGWTTDIAAAAAAGTCMVFLLLIADPVCTAWKVWVWHPAGSWFGGMPLQNILGWFLTGAVLVLLFRRILHRPGESRMASVDAPLGLLLYISFLALLPALSHVSAFFYFLVPVTVLVPAGASLYAFFSARSESGAEISAAAVAEQKND